MCSSLSDRIHNNDLNLVSPEVLVYLMCVVIDEVIVLILAVRSVGNVIIH